MAAGISAPVRADGSAVRASGDLIASAFRSYLLLSILITLSATLGMMIDNVIGGNCIGPSAVAAIGMSLPLLMLFSGCAGIIETGSVALSARALGDRDRSRVNTLFSLAMACAVVVGVVLSVVCVMFADDIATLFGAVDGALHDGTANFIRGLSHGACFVMVTQVLMGFCRIDDDPSRGLVAIVAMSLCDVCGNLIAVLVLDAGLLGMGMATACAYAVATLICCTHFFSEKNTLHFHLKASAFSLLPHVLRTGLPDSLSRLCVLVRTFLFNHLLLIVSGAAAVTALSMQSSVNSFLSAVTIGVGQTATLLCGVFYGERDRHALSTTLKVASRYGLVISVLLCAIVFAFAPDVVRLFGIEDGEAFEFGVVCVRAFALCVPVDLVNSLFVSYYQSTGNLKAADLVTVGQAFLFSALFALVTVWSIGTYGVWLSFLVGELVVLVLQVVVAGAVWKRSGRGPVSLLAKMMYLPDEFDASNRATLELSSGADVEETVGIARQVARFCTQEGISAERANMLSLAVEEMAGNIAAHGFAKTKKPAIDVKVVISTDDAIILRIRDNGMRFNPLDYDLTADPLSCIGLRMVRSNMRDIDYQNILGLNNLVVNL